MLVAVAYRARWWVRWLIHCACALNHLVRCMKKTKTCILRVLARSTFRPWRPIRFSGGLGRCKTGAIRNAQNYLCCGHSAETTFEPHGKKLQDASAIFGTFGSFLEAPGALENGALVCALASFCRNPSSRLRGLGTLLKPSLLSPRFGHFGGVGEN